MRACQANIFGTNGEGHTAFKSELHVHGKEAWLENTGFWAKFIKKLPARLNYHCIINNLKEIWTSKKSNLTLRRRMAVNVRVADNKQAKKSHSEN